MKLTIVTGTALAMATAACTSAGIAEAGRSAPDTAIASREGSWPAEFAGRSFEVVAPSGVNNVVNLAADGSLTVVPALGGGVVKGTWTSKGAALCTRFVPRGEECWDPAAVVAGTGEFVTVRSNRGQQLRIRLLGAREEQLLDGAR